jgi:hypothetical protein
MAECTEVAPSLCHFLLFLIYSVVLFIVALEHKVSTANVARKGVLSSD